MQIFFVVALEWKFDFTCVVVFHQRGKKCTFWATKGALSGVKIKIYMWWHFVRRAKKVHFELHTGNLLWMKRERMLYRRGGISPKRPKMYILSCKLAHLCVSEVKIRFYLAGGGISTEKPKIYILSYISTLFCGYGVKLWLYLRGGILPERPKMFILSYQGHFVVNQEWKLEYICGGISSEGPKQYILSYKNWQFAVDEKWPDRPKLYILSCKVALFCLSEVTVKFYLCSGISLERPDIYILSFKLPPCCGGVKKRLYLPGGISSERAKM